MAAVAMCCLLGDVAFDALRGGTIVFTEEAMAALAGALRPSWLLLAVGMVIIVVIAARNVGFKAGQWAVLIVATVALAGLSVWIIGWGDDETEA